MEVVLYRSKEDWISEAEWDDHKHLYRAMDLVEFESSRPLWGLITCNHWAICIGDEHVLHVTTQHTLRTAFWTSLGLWNSSMPAKVFDVASAQKRYEKYATDGIEVLAGKFCHPSPLDDPRTKGNSTDLYYVRIDHILTVAGGRRFRVRNKKPLGDLVVRKIEELYEWICDNVGKTFKYSARNNNCEHFVHNMRWKKP